MRVRFRVLAGIVVVIIASTPAAAEPAHATTVRRLSGGSPFPNQCGITGAEADRGAETEPTIAVNPRDPKNIIVASHQDRFPSGGALDIFISMTRDGGRTWKGARAPRLSQCSGGSRSKVTDPWLSFGPDGTAYLSTMALNPSSTPFPPWTDTLMQVSRSRDGGTTWSKPAAMSENAFIVEDRESVVADPGRPGHAYGVWRRDGDEPLRPTTVRFSRTTDGGLHWSAPTTILAPAPEVPTVAEIEILPDGDLLAAVALIPLATLVPAPSQVPVSYRVVAIRSEDEGATWSEPVTIIEAELGQAVQPGTENAVRGSEGSSQLAVAPDGSAYVAVSEQASDRPASIRLARSTDGGESWEETTRVTEVRSGAPFLPMIAVLRDGTIGITYYSTQGDEEGDEEWTTEVRFAHSHDEGQSWESIRLAGPFDMTGTTFSTPGPLGFTGFFVGDYHGLAALPNGFAAAFSLGPPAAKKGKNDIFYASIRA